MAVRIYDSTWMDDNILKDAITEYIKRGLERTEILSYMNRDFAQYAWSIRSLDRRINYFEIKRHERNITVDEVKNVVALECEGPGKLLGYRAMTLKVRQKHKLNVPRDLVYAAMTDVDPQGLDDRKPAFKKKKKKGCFYSAGPCWVFSLDGHDKLMGYQNNTFPLAILWMHRYSKQENYFPESLDK